MNLKNIKGQEIILIILLGFILSVCLSINYVSKFDKYEVSSDNFENHSMIKSDIQKYWMGAVNLNQQLENKKKYFKTGNEYRYSYLPERIIFIFYKLTNFDLYDFDKQKIKNNNGKLLFFIIQALIYYLSLIFFSKQILKIFPKINSLIIIAFLAFEPTLLLFHSSFWSESIFFSLQIILLTLLLQNSKKMFLNIVIGLTVGLLFLQRSVGMWYIIPIILYYILNLKKQSIKPILFILAGYLSVVIFLGTHNYVRSNIFYFMPTQTKDGIYDYFLPAIISKEKNISINEATVKLIEENDEWIKKNKINLNLEKERIQYYNYKKDKSLKIILSNPFTSIIQIIKKTIHFSVLDPFRHVYYFYKYEYRGSEKSRFYKSEKQQKMIPLRIIYSLIIYFVSFFGFLFLFQKKKKDALLLFLFSTIYFVIMGGWIGNTRYFAPCLIYISLFFGNGLPYLMNLVRNYKK